MIRNMVQFPEKAYAALTLRPETAATDNPLKLTKGTRHSFFVSIAGYWRMRGFNGAQIEDLLVTVNEVATDEKLSRKEIRLIARGIGKYETLASKHTRCLADVEETEPRFVLDPYIVVRQVNVLEGDPSVGKSSLLAEISACVTAGKKFCGVTPAVTGRVLFFALEDDVSSVFKIRARQQGADQSMIDYVPDFLSLDDQGFEYLHQALSKNRYALVIIDTLTSSLGGSDMNKSSDMAPLLKSLIKIAEMYETAFLVVRHFRKGGSDNPHYAGGGSIAITGAVRSSMFVKLCPENPDERYLAHSKSNGVRNGQTLIFGIQDVPGSRVGKLEWKGTSPLTAEDIMSANPPSQSDIEVAQKFLKKYLSKGPVQAKEVYADAKVEGISERTLNRAKSALRVKSSGGPGSQWSLPH